MAKIYNVGETTYDIIFKDGIPKGAVVGGSVLNTSVSLGRLGFPVCFISRMGNDKIGDLSLGFLKENGINCDYITRFDGNSRLALAFMDEENNANYQFYKAEKSPSLIFPELIMDDIVTFGSTNALRDEGRNNLLLFLNQAHDKNILTIYDPNIREFGALELIEVRNKFEENCQLTKVLKGSNQDFKRLYETENADEIYEKVRLLGVEILIITFGSNPVELRTPKFSLSVNVEAVKTLSTIGAGDNFNAGLVCGFSKFKVDSETLGKLSREEWTIIIEHAAKLAAEVCQSESNYISLEFAKKFCVNCI